MSHHTASVAENLGEFSDTTSLRTKSLKQSFTRSQAILAHFFLISLTLAAVFVALIVFPTW